MERKREGQREMKRGGEGEGRREQNCCRSSTSLRLSLATCQQDIILF